MIPFQSSFGTLPDFEEHEICLPHLATKGKPCIIECSRLIKQEYRKVQVEMEELVQAFYKEFPTRLNRRGYTISPRRELDEGKKRIRKLFWRKYYLRGFGQKAPASILDVQLKKKAEFEYGKERYRRLPSAFWQKTLRPKTKERFKFFDSRLALLNKKIDHLAEMNKKIRAMHQSLVRNSLFKKPY